jgi:hypothetical protein
MQVMRPNGERAKDKLRRMDERKGQGNGTGEKRKEVAGGSSKVSASADAGLNSAGRSHLRCDARLEGQPQPRKVDNAPLKFGQRDGRPTSAGPRQKGEENSSAELDGVAGRTDGASLYESWGAYFEARSRVAARMERRKVPERDEALAERASFLSTGPVDVSAKANKKRKDGASPQDPRTASPESGHSESKNAEVKIDQKSGDNKQGGRQERTKYIIRGPPQCQKAKCTRRAYYGYRRSSSRLIPEWCGEHKKSDMARRNDYLCEVEGCFISAFYAFPAGGKGRSRCRQHKEKGMIMIGYTCEIEGCSTIATFRRRLSEFKSKRCSAHKEEGMAARIAPSMGTLDQGVPVGHFAKNTRKTGWSTTRARSATGHQI